MPRRTVRNRGAPSSAAGDGRSLFHIGCPVQDAAQSVSKVPVKARELGVDLLTVVGHKFGAPKARRGREGSPLNPTAPHLSVAPDPTHPPAV